MVALGIPTTDDPRTLYGVGINYAHVRDLSRVVKQAVIECKIYLFCENDIRMMNENEFMISKQ